MEALRNPRRALAFLLVGLADWIYPSPTLGIYGNPALDAHLANLRRRARHRKVT